FPVFERTTRQVSLTQSGEKLLARASALSRAMDQFQDEVRRLQLALKSELRVGFMFGTAVEFFPEIFREFERMRPYAILLMNDYD
ncbi:hypothetical protein OFN51_37425, partial [Escherichia coli]|nr:hypothetical protein [Escherichia coli]